MCLLGARVDQPLQKVAPLVYHSISVFLFKNVSVNVSHVGEETL